MKKNCLYERGIGWVQYENEEVFLALRRERLKICARMRRQKRCGCPKEKQWRCDGVCEGCRFQRTVDVSLNTVLGDSEDLRQYRTITYGAISCRFWESMRWLSLQ